MTTINEINQAIMWGTWTDEQLNSMFMAIKFAKSQLGKKNKYAFNPGDAVQFVARGRMIRGTVVKIMQKNVQVKEGLTTWKVPANMLQAA